MPLLRFGVLLLLPVALFADDPEAILRKAQADLNAGRYPSAISGAEQASKLFRPSGNLSKAASAVTITGLAQMYSGAYEAALGNFHDALKLSQQANDIDHEATSLNNIGTVLYFEGRYSDAMEHYREAMDRVPSIADTKARASRRQLTIANTAILYQTLGQYQQALALYGDLLNAPQALPATEQAQVLANIGVLRRRLGDPAKALLTYRSAQSVYKTSGLLDGEIAVLNNIGIVQAMDLSDFGAAAATFTLSLELAEKSGNRPLAVQAHLYRGETFFRAADLRSAGSDFTAAWEGATQLGSREEQWKAEYGLAGIAIRQGDRVTGTQRLRHAIQTIEQMRGALSSASLRTAFLADKRNVYDLLIENTNDIEELFNAMEQSRARVLRDRGAPGNTRSLQRLSATLPRDTAVLEYWVGPSSAAALWISAKETNFKRWTFSAADRENLALVRAEMSDPNRQPLSSIVSLAAQLLAGVSPLRDPDIRRVVIVPDGPLSQIPFEALPFEIGLLIDRFGISYSPSAAWIATAPVKRAVRWFWQPGFEAFADPAPGSGGSDVVNTSGFARLPEAAREVHGIVAALGGRPVLHEGSNALKTALMHPSGAPVLHFASHAFADIENPDLSYVLLAPSSPSQRFDYLFRKEIGYLPLTGVSLLTLSACETAVGKIIPGEGVQSFSGAFLAAGVPSVVTSLWAVGDKATADLMVRLYSRLALGETVEDALRGAKLEFLHSRTATHPAYWAAFIVNGDGRTRLPRVIGWTWFVLPVILLAAGAIWKRRSVRTQAGTE